MQVLVIELKINSFCVDVRHCGTKETNLSPVFCALNGADDPMLAGVGTCATFIPIYPSLPLGAQGAAVFWVVAQPAIDNETRKTTVIAAIGFQSHNAYARRELSLALPISSY